MVAKMVIRDVCSIASQLQLFARVLQLAWKMAKAMPLMRRPAHGSGSRTEGERQKNATR